MRGMDAPNPSAVPTAANRTPLHIGAVGLAVRDLETMEAFYQGLLGLAVIDRTSSRSRLGAGGVAFLELEQRPDLKPDDGHSAGLYHTAFLFPTRADHARWVMHIARNHVKLTGASDHGVSEAFYLDDPEGNGVEVYNDRPPELWQRDGDLIVMPTKALDVQDLIRASNPTESYIDAPAGLRIGHIHLRVGNVEQAETFYRGAVGLDLTRRRGGATFMSSGGYHHHVGANVWHSDGAGMRSNDHAGLAWFAMEAANDQALDQVKSRLAAAGASVVPISNGIEATDPWGTRVRFVRS
jgi:catechol 2,3-dioxygenase